MDRATARDLPEEFLQSGGTSIERALSLVLLHWGSYPSGHQRQLAQAFVALLEPLLNAAPRTVPEALREECARIVALWEERWADTVANMATITKATAESRTGTSGTSGAHRASAPAQRAVKFVSVDVGDGEGGHRARVQLERRSGGFYQGTAEDPDTIRCAAQAAAEAISRVLAGKGWTLAIEQTTVADTFGKRTVFVQVAARSQGEHRLLLGFCLIDADPARAAALAVLNATNRFLDLELGGAHP